MRMYEVTPIRIVLPAVGTLETKPRPLSEVRDEQVIHITGARTFSTTLSDAQREAQAMLADTRASVEGGHPEASSSCWTRTLPSSRFGGCEKLSGSSCVRGDCADAAGGSRAGTGTAPWWLWPL